MIQHDGYLRLVTSMNGIWRTNQLAVFLSTLDNLVCRCTAACMLADLLRRHNEELANLQAMGLLQPGMVPDNWREANQGTDALTRKGYLDVAMALKRHGIIIKRDQLGWRVDLECRDILELVPTALHLEVDFIQIASPGLGSFIQAGSKFAKDQANLLRHIFDRWMDPDAMERLLEAEVEFRELQVELAKEEAAQAHQKTRMIKSIADRLARDLESMPTEKRAAVPDYTSRRDSLKASLIEGGLPQQKVDNMIIQPLEDSIDRLARLVCDGLVSAISVDHVANKE